MSVQKLLKSLINNPANTVSIKGKSKKIIGFAEFKTINLGDDGYYKIIFDDHSFLFIVPSQNMLFFTEESPKAYSEIADKDIGTKKEIVFRNKKYILDNPHDYQYVIRLIVGNWKDIEGEVKFSDYVPKDGTNEILSLGWIVRTGARGDINPKELDIKDIELG